jgi:hypothetical protein
MKRILPFAVIVLLGACSGQNAQQQQAQAVDAVSVALTAAERAATAYVMLPPCPSPNGTVCSDPSTVAKIKAADNAAYAAVVAYRNGTGTQAAADAALAVLASLIPAATVK